MSIAQTKTLIRQRLGLSFEGHAEERLHGALAEHMAALDIRRVADYLALLDRDEGALHTLAGLLTVKETYFYREPQHLRLLVEHLAPALLAGRGPNRPIRILSAGCATGEEPYSIVMALRERWGESAERLFRVCATDVDRHALEQARTGRYRPLSFRALDPGLRGRWFGPPAPDGTRAIAESIRRQVEFRQSNLLDLHRPDAGLADQDLIFYRNLSIYFDAHTRASVLGRLSAWLNPRGFLIVGTCETLANDLGLMALCERDGVWFFAARAPGIATALARRTAAPPAAAAAAPARATPAPPACAGSSRATKVATDGGEPDCEPDCEPNCEPNSRADRDPDWDPSAAERAYRQALSLARAERIDSALGLLTPLCDRPSASPESLTLLAQLHLERGDPERARAAVQLALSQDPWSAEALVLLGRIAHAQGAAEEAIAALRKAIYQCPNHWPAHYRLAECHRAAGNAEAAGREYRIVLRQLADGRAAAEQTGPLPWAIPIKDLRLLCQARLAGLAGTA
jgi:chemotaxis protein methyltransferase CheR